MPGPVPKPSHLRQRANRESTRATLPTVEEAARAIVPALPELDRGDWHPMVLQWWETVWTSPMAAEYLDADREALYMLARLHQDFYKAKKSFERQKIAAEIRQQG